MLKNSHQPDYILAGVVGTLLIFGILVLTSISATISYDAVGNTTYFLKHQIIFGLIPGLILAYIAFKIDLMFLKKLSPFLLLANLALMAMVFLPVVGLKTGGAHRWITFSGISFQPSEILKLSFILYLASWLENRTEKTQFRKQKEAFSETFVAFLAVIILMGSFTILQKDLSTLGIIFLVAVVMYFSAGTPLWHLGLLTPITIGALIFLIKFEPYRLSRILVMLGRRFDPMREGYQLKQALITIGSGGIFGVGLGMSKQRFGFLPAAMSDAIFPILAEETGLVGGMVLIFLFLAFLVRGFTIVKRARDKFSQLIAMGITFWIVVQAFINISAMAGMLPIVGIPLPFISYGGSALISELIGIGILLNVSKNTT